MLNHAHLACTKIHATSQFSLKRNSPLCLFVDVLSYMVLLTDWVDVMSSSGRRTCCEGRAWKWHSGALSGQTLGHQTGHQCCHYSTEGWPGVYTNTNAHGTQIIKSSRKKKEIFYVNLPIHAHLKFLQDKESILKVSQCFPTSLPHLWN